MRAARAVAPRERRPGRVRLRQALRRGVREGADHARCEGLRGVDRRDPPRPSAERGRVRAEHLERGVDGPAEDARSGGHGALKVENAMTQPTCRGRRQARRCLKSPPRSLPFFTVTLPPSRTADTSRLPHRALRVDLLADQPAQDEGALGMEISTTPRPLLKRRRYVRHASTTSPYADASIAGVTVCGGAEPRIVIWR